MQDIRWKQRYQNYLKAFGQLSEALSIYDETAVALIKEGVLRKKCRNLCDVWVA